MKKFMSLFVALSFSLIGAYFIWGSPGTLMVGGFAGCLFWACQVVIDSFEETSDRIVAAIREMK